MGSWDLDAFNAATSFIKAFLCGHKMPVILCFIFFTFFSILIWCSKCMVGEKEFGLLHFFRRNPGLRWTLPIILLLSNYLWNFSGTTDLESRSPTPPVFSKIWHCCPHQQMTFNSHLNRFATR